MTLGVAVAFALYYNHTFCCLLLYHNTMSPVLHRRMTWRECLCANFASSILTQAPVLPSPRGAPQADQNQPQPLPYKAHKGAQTFALGGRGTIGAPWLDPPPPYTPPASATCCMCGATVTPRHYTRECPQLDFFRIAIHAQLALAISDFVPRWSINCVTLSGIQIFYGNSSFGISVGPAALAGPMVYPCANLGFTGEATPADEKLCSVGVSRTMCCVIH